MSWSVMDVINITSERLGIDYGTDAQSIDKVSTIVVAYLLTDIFTNVRRYWK